jgi:epoxyqueuosine reductase
LARGGLRRRRRAAFDDSPAGWQALADRLIARGPSVGLDAVGITTVEPFAEARTAIEDRKRRGLADTMGFTFAKPERSTEPASALPGAASLIVAARRYKRADAACPSVAAARVARYSWIDHYKPLRSGLESIAAELRSEGFRTRVMADDNALVDRAAAYRAGLGWLGKNANLLLPGMGSWFVLGAIVTDAVLPPSAPERVPDGCGGCVRCLDACPTRAIIEPGVVDARRCLAWLVQKPGDFPEEFRRALADRIYGCDDCQEVCPPNRTADRHHAPAPAEPASEPWIPVEQLLRGSDAELLSRHGRFYLPERDPNILRRNALLVWGNLAAEHRTDPSGLRSDVESYVDHDDPAVANAARWALQRAEREEG